MNYDPIKHSLGSVFNRAPWLRKLFYRLLDLLLLRAWHVHKELKKYGRRRGFSAPVKMLDAGAGYGQYSWWFKRYFPNASILAVDVKEEQVQDCNEFFKSVEVENVLFQVADLTVFNKPGEFDIALSVDVMEHILEDELVFRNISQSLKPGGMLVISTPSDQGGSDVHGDDDASFIGEHVRDGYNRNDIIEKLKRAGFAEVEARYSYGWPGKISWRLSMKYPIQLLGVSKWFFIVLPIYYLLCYPFAYLLNWLDVSIDHATGTGLIVIARKS